MYIRPGLVVFIVGATLTSLSTIIMFLRYYCRFYLMGTVGVTDHLMFVAVVLTWGNTVINYYQDQTSSKFRPSQFRNPAKKDQIADALRGTLITWYIYRVTYVVALLFVKLSILFFYRAIASHATFRRFVYATMTVVSLYTFAASIASIFQCDNPADAWDISFFLSQFDGVPGRRESPKCYEPTRIWVVSGAFNLFSDVVILLLPIPALLGLRVPMNKRLALIGIFSIGIMAIVASCVRMWVMALWSASPQNSAQFGADLLLWGQVETNSGIISASVPFLRLIFRGRQKGAQDEEKRRIIGPPRLLGPEPNAAQSGVEQGQRGIADVDDKELERGQAAHIGDKDLERGGNRPLKLDSMAFFSGPYEGPNGSPVWQPFITVPESLSSGSRESALLEREAERGTVTV